MGFARRLLYSRDALARRRKGRRGRRKCRTVWLKISRRSMQLPREGEKKRDVIYSFPQFFPFFGPVLIRWVIRSWITVTTGWIERRATSIELCGINEGVLCSYRSTSFIRARALQFEKQIWKNSGTKVRKFMEKKDFATTEQTQYNPGTGG